MCLQSSSLIADTKTGKVIDASLVSTYLEGNALGINVNRSIKIYLPPNYEASRKRYPVIYYFHSLFWSPGQMFADGKVKETLDKGISGKTIDEFIFVVGDFTAPNVGVFFSNSQTSGRWMDHVVEELIPFVDKNYRTLPVKESRGLTGDFLGAYAALKLAMLYPDKFNAVYALHPVGTGTGLIPMVSRPDWKKMNQATSWDDLAGDGFSQVFIAMAQAYLPNPQRPPFYCDWMVDFKNGQLVVNEENTKKLQSGFLLDQMLLDNVGSLKKIGGIKFDWARYDSNQDHIYSNQAFTRKLDEQGIAHEAEEYGGNTWEKHWITHGRVATDVLPFFQRILIFDKNNK